MINQLATLLFNKIINANAPWMDIVGGIARTQSNQIPTSEENAGLSLQKYPVVYLHNQPDCVGPELDMIPDGNKKSMIYFEDGNTTGTTWLNRPGYTSNIRLVMWMNRVRLIANAYGEISANIEQQLINLLAPNKHENWPGFTRLLGEASRIPSQDASIFGRYTYTETDKQYLRPPYDFFAIDFTFRYNVGEGCMMPITYEAATCF